MRPIEMQVIMARTVDTSQLVSQNQQAAIAAQQNTAVTFQNQMNIQQTQVQALNRSETKSVGEKQGGSGGGYTPYRRRHSTKRKRPIVTDENKGRFIDIRS